MDEPEKWYLCNQDPVMDQNDLHQKIIQKEERQGPWCNHSDPKYAAYGPDKGDLRD